MAKETIEQTVGLCREAMTNVRNAYDRGYKQGYKDGKTDVVTTSYEKGLNDAWEAARRIVLPSDCYANGLYGNMKEIFGLNDYLARGVFTDFSASEAIAKIKEYEEKQKEQVKEEEFKVGDEVIADTQRFVVLSVGVDGWCNLWCLNDGLTCDSIYSKCLKKTGRSFPQLAELFKQMKEG